MGMTHIEMEVVNPSEMERSTTVRLIVDSGLRYSVVSEETLNEIGIRPIAEERFELTNGDTVTRKKGAAIFKYQGRIGGSDVVFGEPGDVELLGRLTLGSLGFALDPLRREFHEVPLMLA